MIFPDFFETNTFFIDEKVGFFKFANAYKVYDTQGEIGLIQQKLTGGQKALRLLLKKPMLPFKLEITDLQAGYEFHYGPLKGLSLLFQANNIHNTPYTEYKDDPSVISKQVFYGKTYLFGVNYRL